MPAKIVKFIAHSSKFIVFPAHYLHLAGSRLASLRYWRESFIFTLCVLSFTLACYAAPCYGTKLPEKKGVFIGTQTHAIFKRYLENEFGKVRSLQHFLLLSYGLFDWLAIDLKGGAGYIKQRPVTSAEVDYPTNFAGGYGFRLKFYNKEDLKMVFGFQHISVHPHSVHLGTVKNSAVLDDWQYSLLVSKDIFKVTPYLGARWSRADYIHWAGPDRKRVMSDLTKSIGLICGIDIPVGKKAWVNLEGEFLDSEAFAFSLNYNF